MAASLVPSPVRSLGRATRLKLLGLLFIAIVVAVLGLTVAVYQKVFADTVAVTLKADSSGNQLGSGADVKLRGIIVGRVSDVDSHGDVATLSLQLDPEDVGLIPANVKAALLPKTLFGEKFVDLIIPAKPAAAHIAAGDVIPQDRSTTAIEAGQVFDDLLPVLRTLKPAELNATLNALATALQDRGDALGNNLVLADRYFAGLDPSLPTIQHDISGLADLAASYADNAPELLRFARNFAFTSRTLADKDSALAGFLRGTAGFADKATTVLTDNANRLIELAGVSRPTLETLANYAGEIPCTFYGLFGQSELLNNVFGGPQGPFLHITVEAVKPQPAYGAGEVPSYAPGQTFAGVKETPYANCHGLPQPGGKFPVPLPDSSSAASGQAAYSSAGPSVGNVGSPAEKSAIDAIVSRLTGTAPSAVSDLADLLVAPMLRGMAVGVGG